MSTIKEHLLDVQSQRADEWIRERAADPELDENSEEYEYLADEYSAYQDHLWDEAEWQAELKWLTENGSSNIHNIFMTELDALKVLAESNQANKTKVVFILHSDMAVKMSYAHAVTLLESFLGDTLKSIISQNDCFLKNAIEKFKIFKNVKLSELIKTDLNINSLVNMYLSDVLFHNIPNVIEMYEQVLGVHLDINISKIVKITKLRHDIVHRNGRSIDGSAINLQYTDFSEAIEDIRTFSYELQKVINQAEAA
ncbi:MULTISPECIES: hypothetical protein [unclassified Vibrio]|uniref:hypothetical protein n=1 Tax=unclassified Vibrio TaxID=2614977 RepID=UPI0010BD70BE|nr:hypothetical protein [Vibrio sp. F13]TKG03095.1 hypothetical protein FCV76_06835 [Vibrio sp. F13]